MAICSIADDSEGELNYHVTGRCVMNHFLFPSINQHFSVIMHMLHWTVCIQSVEEGSKT